MVRVIPTKNTETQTRFWTPPSGNDPRKRRHAQYTCLQVLSSSDLNFLILFQRSLGPTHQEVSCLSETLATRSLASVWVRGYPNAIHPVHNHLCAEGVGESATPQEGSRLSLETATLLWQPRPVYVIEVHGAGCKRRSCQREKLRSVFLTDF